MNLLVFKRCAMGCFLAAAMTMASGCGSKTEESGSPAPDVSEVSANVDDHSGWWCAPHGVPEEQCSMCSASAAAKCKESGDWCEEHNRAESQCFLCDPSRAEHFTKLYIAKNGEDPPKRDD